MRPASRTLLLGAAASFVSLVFAACADEQAVETRSAAERGAAVFRDPRLSPNTFNPFTCATCHAAGPVPAGLKLPGGSLAGVAKRSSFWAGQETTLLDSVNVCMRSFLSAANGLSPTEDRAVSLYAYLASLEGDGAPVPFTVVQAVADVPAGDAARGALVWDSACRSCHGAPHTAEGQLPGIDIVIPEATIAEHVPKGDDVRLIVIEKVRHGSFLGYSGRMPPFSLEVLSDAELADLLSYLGLDR